MLKYYGENQQGRGIGSGQGGLPEEVACEQRRRWRRRRSRDLGQVPLAGGDIGTKLGAVQKQSRTVWEEQGDWREE